MLVLLHGVGADGNDLIALAPYYRAAVPDALVVAPNAPEAFDMAPFGYQWFSISDLEAKPRADGVRRAAPVLDAFIDAELGRLGLGDDKLILCGFSQGAMMALHVGLRRKVPVAALISHSGMLVGAERLAAEIRSRPPALLTHGAEDDVVPPAALPAAEAALKAAGVPVRSLLVPGLGHGIDETTLRAAVRFLADVVAAKKD
ncbi:MAG: prolyl oligopeptidase family serine peptidase [Rhodospirillales bacterium]|nr:prolyl oligopeptidase family serine peptidase [Rhodospirillales bacterium]